MNATLSTESAVTKTQNNDSNIFIQALNEIDENQVEEKVQENIGTDISPKLNSGDEITLNSQSRK